MKPDFELEKVLHRIEEAIRPFPKAAMFELSERGYTTLFEQLISCIISIRTLDETTIPVSLRLFEVARTPEAVLKISPAELTELLDGSTYPEQKTYTLSLIHILSAILPSRWTVVVRPKIRTGSSFRYSSR